MFTVDRETFMWLYYLFFPLIDNGSINNNGFWRNNYGVYENRCCIGIVASIFCCSVCNTIPSERVNI